MTIQIYGSFFTGTETYPIEKYYDNLDEAQAAWDRIISRYSNALGGKIYAVLNPGDNVRPERGYGASIGIGGELINVYTLR
jgi:hypothetical protein